MAVKPKQNAGQDPAVEPVTSFVQGAMHAQRRALDMTQAWSETILTTIKEQAASYGALLKSVDASLTAMQQAVKSQAEATKALADSLDASRQVVRSAMEAQQHSIAQVEGMVGGILKAVTGQLDTLRAQVKAGQDMLASPAAAQSELFLSMTQDWMDAYSQLMGGSRPAGRSR